MVASLYEIFYLYFSVFLLTTILLPLAFSPLFEISVSTVG